MELVINEGDMGRISEFLNMLQEKYPDMKTTTAKDGGIKVNWKDLPIKSEPRKIDVVKENEDDSSHSIEKEN